MNYKERIESNLSEIAAIKQEREIIEKALESINPTTDEVSAILYARLRSHINKLDREEISLITENKTLAELENQVTIDEVLKQNDLSNRFSFYKAAGELYLSVKLNDSPESQEDFFIEKISEIETRFNHWTIDEIITSLLEIIETELGNLTLEERSVLNSELEFFLEELYKDIDDVDL